MARLKDDFPGAEKLRDAGITTHAKVEAATDEELLAIDGIGAGTLRSIREWQPEIENKSLTEEITDELPAAHLCGNRNCGREITESPCPYCGHA